MTQVVAAVLNSAPGRLDIEQLHLADPGPREVVVRITHAGLCHSDLHEMDGTFPADVPIVLGHEAAGVVEEVGAAVTDVAVGDHVVTCLSAFCGTCHACLSGRQTLCTARPHMGGTARSPRLRNSAGRHVRPTAGIGAFAERAVIHERSLVSIDPAVPLSVASILGCAVTTGVGAVVRRAKVPVGATVVAIGAGGVGLAVIAAARLSGASRIVAVDLNDHKLAVATTVGATDTVNASEGDPVADVIEITRGGADFTFEAVGSPRTAEQALAMLAPGGTATLVGMVPDHSPVRVLGSDLYLHEKRLQGSFMGSNRFRVDVPTYADLYLQGRLALDRIVHRVIPLELINEGFDELAAGESLRTIIEMDTP
ncbi:Zn-dependent alcohol dehydrogenase [Mycolicibacterium sp.]|uniref:Zn-dependent alcohol dehydrogenase n=1 Tax=Mycolicibacterium sp. TaxID=2320850 RepID=UPI0037C6088C